MGNLTFAKEKEKKIKMLNEKMNQTSRTQKVNLYIEVFQSYVI